MGVLSRGIGQHFVEGMDVPLFERMCLLSACACGCAVLYVCDKETRWLGIHKRAGTSAGNHRRHTQENIVLCSCCADRTIPIGPTSLNQDTTHESPRTFKPSVLCCRGRLLHDVTGKNRRTAISSYNLKMQQASQNKQNSTIQQQVPLFPPPSRSCQNLPQHSNPPHSV